MTYFLRTFDEEGRSPFLAIPVFPVRAFRHGAIYINRNSGIEKPQILVGSGSASSPFTLDQNIKGFALGVDGAPQIGHAAIDLEIDFVEMPGCVRLGAAAMNVWREAAAVA
jgi:hypothetical protein